MIATDLALRVDAAKYVKKPRFFAVQFADTEQTIATLEGPVLCRAGDAIVTGTAGEQWPVPKEVFFSKYVAVPPTCNGESGQYQSLPQTVLAVQIRTVAEIELSAGRGRLTGAAGDWLVQYAPGDCGIVRDDIFRHTYECAQAK
jgi:hypothetical protein